MNHPHPATNRETVSPMIDEEFPPLTITNVTEAWTSSTEHGPRFHFAFQLSRSVTETEAQLLSEPKWDDVTPGSDHAVKVLDYVPKALNVSDLNDDLKLAAWNAATIDRCAADTEAILRSTVEKWRQEIASDTP